MNCKKYHRDRDYFENEKLFKNIFQKRINITVNFVSHSRGGILRVLEMGCSHGFMLDIFKENGWETWGVEPSQSANTAKMKGHKIIKDYFEKAKLPENYFDLVIANHTLEHMDNPTAVLMKVRNLLKKEAIVFVDVPNAGGLGARILGKHWPYLLPEEHKWQFTKEILSKIFKDAGFKVIYFESRSGLFDFENPFLELWQSFIGLKMRFFTDILTTPYSLLATILNMGDSMSLVGKK